MKKENKTKNSWEKEFDKLVKRGLEFGVFDYPMIKSFIREIIDEKVGEYRDALIWCSGSNDFQEGGIARKGWLKICRPLLIQKITQSKKEVKINYEKRK